MSPEERDLDDDIRNWPRTPLSDPYQAGLEKLAEHLRPRLGVCRLELAYNEFCAPSLEVVVGNLAAGGFSDLEVVSSMFTPGGNHSEIEIPETLDLLRRKHPSVRLRYHWPYDLHRVSDVILDKVRPFREVLR
jgi:sirohydrochlorin cobaltochelatase